uniref:Telomerase reverse transcriptase n=1 Tax=Sexangularia sp. CB-2014 TaxID=1486929 RepID=A0A7S1YHU4_9EUKA|mmetsp:Transcript_4359/g.14145  ORF Transcript_4359/g.14145 Transcript_4359/m.14145 type:complete len:1296 (+) Transcript_4359:793-4680(+)
MESWRTSVERHEVAQQADQQVQQQLPAEPGRKRAGPPSSAAPPSARTTGRKRARTGLPDLPQSDNDLPDILLRLFGPRLFRLSSLLAMVEPPPPHRTLKSVAHLYVGFPTRRSLQTLLNIIALPESARPTVLSPADTVGQVIELSLSLPPSLASSHSNTLARGYRQLRRPSGATGASANAECFYPNEGVSAILLGGLLPKLAVLGTEGVLWLLRWGCIFQRVGEADGGNVRQVAGPAVSSLVLAQRKAVLGSFDKSLQQPPQSAQTKGTAKQQPILEVDSLIGEPTGRRRKRRHGELAAPKRSGGEGGDDDDADDDDNDGGGAWSASRARRERRRRHKQGDAGTGPADQSSRVDTSEDAHGGCSDGEARRKRLRRWRHRLRLRARGGRGEARTAVAARSVNSHPAPPSSAPMPDSLPRSLALYGCSASTSPSLTLSGGASPSSSSLSLSLSLSGRPCWPLQTSLGFLTMAVYTRRYTPWLGRGVVETEGGPSIVVPNLSLARAAKAATLVAMRRVPTSVAAVAVHGEAVGPLLASKERPLVRLSRRERALQPLLARLLTAHAETDWPALLRRTAPSRRGDFVTAEQPAECVVRFLRAALQALLPADLLGSPHNLALLQRVAKLLVTRRRRERLGKRDLLWGARPSNAAWCAATGPPTATAAGTDAFHRVIIFLVEHVLIAALKTFFYGTEVAHTGNAIHWYRVDDWHALARPQLRRILNARFVPLTNEEAASLLANRAFGFAGLRLLPKPDGSARPIANLSKVPGARDAKLLAAMGASRVAATRPTNTTLSTALEVIKAGVRDDPGLVGASVFGAADVHARLVAFRSAHRAAGSPPLYVAGVDVRQAFDSAQHEQLLAAVADSIGDTDRYVVRRYETVNRSGGGRIGTRFGREAEASVETAPFVPFAESLARRTRNTVFVDGVVHRLVAGDEMLALVQEHVRANLVRRDGRFFRQVVGIPQGSVLSSMLCCLLYGRLEAKKLVRVVSHADEASFSSLDGTGTGTGTGTETEGLVREAKALSAAGNRYCGVLLRVVDDFLYISSDLDAARAFATAMLDGFEEYGARAHPDKMKLSFGLAAGGEASSHGEEHLRWIPWNGLLLNAATGDVRGDYSRYEAAPLSATLTVEYDRHPGDRARLAILAVYTARISILMLDAQLNGPITTRLNILQPALLAAAKAHVIWRSLPTRPTDTYILRAVDDCVAYTTRLVDSIKYSTAAHQTHAQIRLTTPVVRYLVLFGWLWVMERKQPRYRNVVPSLRADLAAVRATLSEAAASLLDRVTNVRRYSSVFERIKY